MNGDGPDAAASILFLSCDIVGSTQFKQRSGKKWRNTFANFYIEFPQQLAEAKRDGDDAVEFSLWKAIGDELLFTCTVTSARQVFSAVRTWIRAMDAYQKSSLDDEGLGTKGGAFIATTPWPDGECVIPRNPELRASSDVPPPEVNAEVIEAGERDHNLYQYDYYGPSIDTGFRLFSMASQRYFTLSVEVAWAMLYCQRESQHQKESYGSYADLEDLVLIGPESFKGVWGGREYPLLALDRQHVDPVNQAYEALASNLDGRRLERLMSLCIACSKSPGWPSAIYLPEESHHEHFRTVPEDPYGVSGDNKMDGAESRPSNNEDRSGELNQDAPIS